MDHINLVDDPEDAIIINDMSALTINEPQKLIAVNEQKNGLDQTNDVAQEKSGDVSSDDGNEDPAGDDEEGVIESVFHQLNIDDGVDKKSAAGKGESDVYLSKGPMVQKRSRANNNANTAPYSKTNPSNDNRKNFSPPKERLETHRGNKITSTLDYQNKINDLPEGKCSVGQFVDVASFFPDLGHSLSQQGTAKACGSNGKRGIPSLPDTSPAVVDGNVVLPRVIVYRKPNIHMIPIPQAGIIVHAKLRKLGLQLSQITLEDNQPNEVGKTENYELFVQLDNTRAIRFRTTALISQIGSKYCVKIPGQFVELRPFAGVKNNSGIESLLEGVSENEIEGAISLVNGKDLTDLLKTYGPNEDSMLMHLCCKREEPPVIRAQVFALVSRILIQPNPNTRANVIQKNGSGLSALDYTTVTNNRRIATFLADLYYMMGEDPTCPDVSGNTLLHMLARKGDASAPTLQALIALRYSKESHENERGPFCSSVVNLKRFMPIHHAVMSRRCPQNVIQTLYRDMPACLTAQTDNGSLPIHLACQYSSDPTMIALLLHYNREVINAKRADGFTPLHLVASRNDGPADISIGLIPLNEDIQRRMIRLLLDHGADKSICVEDQYIPYDLVKVERQMGRALLKLPGRRLNEAESFFNQPQTINDLELNSSGKNAIINGTEVKTEIHSPPNHLELKHTNPLDKEDVDNNLFNSLIAVSNNEGSNENKATQILDSIYTNGSSTYVQSQGSPSSLTDRPPSAASSLLSTLSPASSVVMGRDDPFICGGGTTPGYNDSFNLGIENNGSPISNGGGSRQQSPQSIVNHPFYSLYSSTPDAFGRNSRNSLSQLQPASTIVNVSKPYNCYDSLSDSDGERTGTGDSGNESPSSDTTAYSRCIVQEAFCQQPALTPDEDGVNCDLDVIARALYSHPTIQAVMNHADSGDVSNGNSALRQAILQNNL